MAKNTSKSKQYDHVCGAMFYLFYFIIYGSCFWACLPDKLYFNDDMFHHLLGLGILLLVTNRISSHVGFFFLNCTGCNLQMAPHRAPSHWILPWVQRLKPVSSLYSPGCEGSDGAGSSRRGDGILICLAQPAVWHRVLIAYRHSNGLTIITDLFNRNELPSLYSEGLPIPATLGTDSGGGG